MAALKRCSCYVTTDETRTARYQKIHAGHHLRTALLVGAQNIMQGWIGRRTPVGEERTSINDIDSKHGRCRFIGSQDSFHLLYLLVRLKYYNFISVVLQRLVMVEKGKPICTTHTLITICDCDSFVNKMPLQLSVGH